MLRVQRPEPAEKPGKQTAGNAPKKTRKEPRTEHGAEYFIDALLRVEAERTGK